MKTNKTFFNLATDMIGKAGDIAKEYGLIDSQQSELKLMQLHTKTKINEEIEELRQKRLEIFTKLQQSGKKSSEIEKEIEIISKELEKKLTINSFINKIKSSAMQKLFNSDTFIQEALSFKTLETFIISIDIRRSTDLMLKAKSPKLFAEFLVELSTSLKKIILDNYGVYDKFTGDGILAYFPEFFSGEDAGYFAIKSAQECHEEFEKIYKKHFSSFLSVISDTGLGIGIDYGTIYVDQIDDEHVVVGTPVVYACRLASTPAGTTLLNQQAIERVGETYEGFIEFQTTNLEIKHEGKILGYKTTLKKKTYKYKLPSWDMD